MQNRQKPFGRGISVPTRKKRKEKKREKERKEEKKMGAWTRLQQTHSRLERGLQIRRSVARVSGAVCNTGRPVRTARGGVGKGTSVMRLPENNLLIFPSGNNTAALLVHPHGCDCT